MLIDFKFKNFASFKDETIFSMEAGHRLRKYSNTNTLKVGNISLLKTGVIFGPNASGKSNLLKAISLMKSIILYPTDKITDKLPFTPFKSTGDKTTLFSIKFIYKNKIYEYSFEYDRIKFHHEKLVVNNKIYFERDVVNAIFSGREEIASFNEKTRDNRLFLSVAQDFNDSICSNVIKWFYDSLITFTEDIKENQLDIIEDPAKREALISLLQFADLNITGIKTQTIPLKLSSQGMVLKELIKSLTESNVLEGTNYSFINNLPDEKSRKEIYVTYNSYDELGNYVDSFDIPISDESDGTQKLIALALTLLSANDEKVLLMDEFDDAFHLELSKAMIKLFNTTKNENQFILTTHELELMDCELRVDQIWLLDKSYKGSSELYSLFDFKELGSKRTDTSYVKRYLNGQFGAIPTIDFEGMAEALQASKKGGQ